MEQTLSTAHSGLKPLYRIAALMALLITLAGLTDAITSSGVQAQDNSTVAITEWYARFQTAPFEAFSLLGVINIVTLSLGVPIYLAFFQTFHLTRPVTAALSAILFLLGAAVYFSSNTVFALFALSRQYAAAAEVQKPVLEAAGRALLAQGADLTPGTFFGLFFTQLAGLMITSAMLRDSTFSRWAGLVGFTGFGLMAIFFVLTAFIPERYDTAMIIAAPGGLLLMTYQLLLARRFYQLGK